MHEPGSPGLPLGGLSRLKRHSKKNAPVRELDDMKISAGKKAQATEKPRGTGLR